MLRFICRILRTGINVQNNRNSDIIKCTLHKSYILLAVDQGKHIKVSIFGYKIIRILFILLNYSQAWSWLFRKFTKNGSQNGYLIITLIYPLFIPIYNYYKQDYTIIESTIKYEFLVVKHLTWVTFDSTYNRNYEAIFKLLQNSHGK